MKKNIITSLALITTTFMSSAAFANVHLDTDSCDIELNYDLTISPEHIRIIDQDETMVDIYKDKILFLRGEQIQLNQNQQVMITQYATHIRNAIPEVTEIAVEAISMAYEGINLALGNHADMSETQEKFSDLENKLKQKFESKDGHYSFKQGSFNTSIEDEAVDELVEDIVSDVVPQLVGGILSNIGIAMMSGESDLSELEDIGENIEKEMELRGESIEQRAEEFCLSLKKVDELEQALLASNSQFIYLDLLNLKQQSH